MIRFTDHRYAKAYKNGELYMSDLDGKCNIITDIA